MRKPIIKIWDIENLPNVGTFWSLGKQYVGPDQILQERAIICAAWKELHDDYVYHTPLCTFGKQSGVMPPPVSDYEVVGTLIDGLSDADVLIAHNGDRHDLGILNARAIYHGLSPLPPIKQIDTLKVARNRFNFNSNKLDALAKYLKVGEKVKTEYGLWLRCLYGDKKALKEMLAYNISDVPLLEAVYLKLRPFMTTYPNMAVLSDSLDACPLCGSEGTLRKNGRRYRGSLSYAQRYYCTACGGWPSGLTVRAKDSGGRNINVR